MTGDASDLDGPGEGSVHIASLGLAAVLAVTSTHRRSLRKARIGVGHGTRARATQGVGEGAPSIRLSSWDPVVGGHPLSPHRHRNSDYRTGGKAADVVVTVG